METSYEQRASDALTLAARGEHAALVAVLASLSTADSPAAAACRACLALALWSHGEPAGPTPAPLAIGALGAAGASARRWAAAACAEAERACLVAFDRASLETWLAVHRGLVDKDSDEAGRLALRAGTLWRDLMAGAEAEVVTAARELYRGAAAAALSELAIEATALQALAALQCGDLPVALDAARRASRMGRTEALPRAEILANVVLARVRRYSGRPHHALRILQALVRVAPPPWHGWLGWELLLAGGPEALAEAGPRRRSPAGAARQATAADTGERLLAEAVRGEREAMRRSAADLLRDLSSWPAFAEEASVLLAALDAEAPVPAELAAWCSGQVAIAPRGLQGVSRPAPGSAAAYVVVQRGRDGRRVLRAGVPLVKAPVSAAPDAAEAEHHRTDAGLAILALSADAGVDRDDFFRQLYGIAFDAPLHGNVFHVLLHRMRRRLRGQGDVALSEGRLRLVVHAETLVIADPRSAQATADRVLHALAHGAAGAAEIARKLGVSLRTAQLALRELVASGDCRQERVGRTIRYQVEDTTFSEPTALLRGTLR